MPQLSRGPYVLCLLIYEMLKISCGISSENSSSIWLPCFQANAESYFSQNVWLCFLNVPETFSFCHGRMYFLDRDLPMWHLYKTIMWKHIFSHWPQLHILWALCKLPETLGFSIFTLCYILRSSDALFSAAVQIQKKILKKFKIRIVFFKTTLLSICFVLMRFPLLLFWGYHKVHDNHHYELNMVGCKIIYFKPCAYWYGPVFWKHH